MDPLYYLSKWDEMSCQFITGNHSMKMVEDVYHAIGPTGQGYFRQQAQARFGRPCHFAIHVQTRTIILAPMDVIGNEAASMNEAIIFDENQQPMTRIERISAEKLARMPSVAAEHFDDANPVGYAGETAASETQAPQTQAAASYLNEHDNDPGHGEDEVEDGSDYDVNAQQEEAPPGMVRIKRESNVYFIFQKWFTAAKAKGRDWTGKAKLTAKDWKALYEDQRQPWYELAMQHKAMHKEMFPSYKFSQTKKGQPKTAQYTPAHRWQEYKDWCAAHACPPGFTEATLQQLVDEANTRRQADAAHQQSAVVDSSSQDPELAQAVPNLNVPGPNIAIPAPNTQPDSQLISDYHDSQLSAYAPLNVDQAQSESNGDGIGAPSRWSGPVPGFPGHAQQEPHQYAAHHHTALQHEAHHLVASDSEMHNNSNAHDNRQSSIYGSQDNLGRGHGYFHDGNYHPDDDLYDN
ncbi:hypothetical protein F5Y16DRAFT_398818 [Xylariaceae sp. FL0255]|nr:hypothetical protein F5Y16DRAFT_398818 [Xylariaceae sp. FL0255]